MVCYRNCATRSHSPCARARDRLRRVAEGREILIVDDDEDTRTVLQDLLELNGYAVRAFPDARRAIDAACALRPALMLVDYFLPDANGAWLVQQLRDAGLGQVPVVLTTGPHEGRVQVATVLVRATTAGRVKLLALAMMGDSVLSGVEGLALRAGRWWAPWLVVIATSALLPIEIWEVVRRPAWGRAGIIVVNLAVVAYLLRAAAREHRAAMPPQASGSPSAPPRYRP